MCKSNWRFRKYKFPYHLTMKSPPKKVGLPIHGIRMESHRHEHSGAVPLHSHPYPSLLYITSGEGGCRLDGQEMVLLPDQVVWIPPDFQHETFDQPGSPLSIYSIGFSDELGLLAPKVRKALDRAKGPMELPVYATKQIHLLLRSLLHEQTQRAPLFEEAMASILTRILILIVRNVDRPPSRESTRNGLQRVKEVLRDIRENIHEPHSLAEASRMAHLSQRQFSNLCHQIEGDNFISFLNGLRIERAVQLLKESSLPVSSIAFEVGFEDLSTFYRAFKKSQGLPPRDLRKKLDSD